MNELPKHIGHSLCFKKQTVFWNTIPYKKDMEVELINFWKARVIAPTGGGTYMDFVTLFINGMDNPHIDAGEIVVLHISYRCLEIAIERLPLYKKKFIQKDIGNDNIYMKFVKKNEQVMKIKEFELRKEDSDMNKTASLILTKLEQIKDETNTDTTIES